MKKTKQETTFVVRGKKLSVWMKAVNGTRKLIATGKPNTPVGRRAAKKLVDQLKRKVEAESERRDLQKTRPRIVNVSFDVTQEIAAALRALRDTGFYGNGLDCASVAEELLRLALRDPEVVMHWHVTGRLTPARTRAEIRAQSHASRRRRSR